jgi:GNAT superfamily N-acetyltransferase
LNEPPGGLVAAPLTLGDADAVTDLWRACELHDTGEAVFTRADFVVIAQLPSRDLERESVGLRTGGELVAVGMVDDERHAHVQVLPAWRGRGIGGWLLRWTQLAGRAAGFRETGQTVADARADVAALLRADGYTPRWESWVFEIEIARDPGPPPLPPGYAIRPAVPGGDDERAAHRVVDDAFGEWPDRRPWPFDDWRAETVLRPGFAPGDLVLLEHDGAAVGVAVMFADPGELWIDQVAVARAHRGRGLARALLMHAFGVAWRRGLRSCGLSTDARTGARGLYEHVGMRVRRSFTQYARAL